MTQSAEYARWRNDPENYWLDAAHAISAFFLGLHQRNALEPDAHIADRLLALVGLLAPLALPMLTSSPLLRPPS